MPEYPQLFLDPVGFNAFRPIFNGDVNKWWESLPEDGRKPYDALTSAPGDVLRPIQRSTHANEGLIQWAYGLSNEEADTNMDLYRKQYAERIGLNPEQYDDHQAIYKRTSELFAAAEADRNAILEGIKQGRQDVVAGKIVDASKWADNPQGALAYKESYLQSGKDWLKVSKKYRGLLQVIKEEKDENFTSGSPQVDAVFGLGKDDEAGKDFIKGMTPEDQLDFITNATDDEFFMVRDAINARNQGSSKDKGTIQVTTESLFRAVDKTLGSVPFVANRAHTLHIRQALNQGRDIRIRDQYKDLTKDSPLGLFNSVASNMADTGYFASRVATTEERKELEKQVALSDRLVKRRKFLAESANRIVDPTDSTAYHKWISNVTGTIPYVAESILPPWLSIPLIVATLAENHYDKMMSDPDNPNMDPDVAFATSMVVGAASGLVERAGWMLTFGKIRMPRVSDAILSMNSGAARFAARFGVGTVVENVQEAAQKWTENQVQDLLHALDQDVPEVDWEKEYKDYAQELGDTFLTMLPLVLLGSGSQSFDDYLHPEVRQKAMRDTEDRVALTVAGYSKKHQDAIIAAKTPEERIAKLREFFGDRKPQLVQDTTLRMLDMQQKLIDEGFAKTEEQAQAYSVFFDAAIRARSANTGETIDEVYDKIGFDTEGQTGDLYQPAYHGTPFQGDIEQFMTDHVGTGEGRQAFGWGLYFAEKTGVAKTYQMMGGRKAYNEMRDIIPDMAEWDEIVDLIEAGEFSQNQKAFLEALNDDDLLGFDSPIQAIHAALSNQADNWERSPALIAATDKLFKGGLYQVELDVNDSNVLQWDKDMIKQKSIIDMLPAEEVEAMRDELEAHDQPELEDLTGRHFYQLVRRLAADGGFDFETPDGNYDNADRTASLYLESRGLHGIKFLDGTSRKKGEGTYNYVVFNGKYVKDINRLEQDNRGYIKFLEDGKVLFKALDADASTFIHELGHFARRYALSDDHLQTVGSFYGVTDPTGKWTVDAEERFARDFERYFYDGVLPANADSALKKAFKALKKLMRELYNAIKGTPAGALNPDVRAAIDSLFEGKIAPEAQSFNPTKVGGILPQNESLDEATGKRTTAGKVFDAVVQALRLSGSDSPLRISSKSVSGSKGTLGTYFPRDVLASVVQKNNFSVGMHEAAHAIEDAMIGKGDVWKTTTPGITPAMIQELTNIGSQLYPNAKKATKKTEGFAEFMRLWLVDPDTALKWAPEFQKWFDQYMLDPNPAFAKQLRKAQKLALTWQKQGSVARVKQHIYSPSAAEENLKQLELAASKDFLIERMVDSLRPIDEFVKEANLSRAEQGLTPLPANYDPYQVSRAESMSHHQKAQVMATQGMINLNGEIVGPSLKAGLKSVMGKYDDFTAYLYARRAIKLFAQGKKKDPGISEDDANYVYNQYHSPEFDQAARAFYAWWDGVLDYLAESSVDYKNTVDLIRKHDAGDYIPLRREFDAWDQRYKAEYSAGSSAVGAAPIHKLKGSSRRIKNPIMTSLAQVEEYLQKAHDKIVLDQIIEIAQTTPGLGRYVMPVRKDLAPAAIRSIDDLLTEINRGLKRQGADPAITDTVDTLQEAIELEGLNDVLLTFFAPRWDPKKGENPILPVFRGGKVRWYEMDHHLYGALNSNTDSKWPWYIRSTLGASARIFRMGTTGLRPRFTLITNPIRDFKTFLYNTQSSAHSPEVFLTYMRSLGREALRASFGKYTSAEAQALREFFDNHGLTIAGSMGQDIDFNARAARSLFDSGFTRLLRPRNWTDFLRDFLQFPESAARIAEVELLMKDMGVKPGDKLTREQGIILANAAKQVTTDFTAGGDTARKWNQIVPFLNAQIQGPKAHLDALQRNPFKFIRRGIESALFTAALWWSHKDDDWWTEMGAKERLGYTYIPWGKEMWRLPRAFQADGIFMAGTEALLDAAYRQDPAFITDWMFQFVATTATPSLPPIVEETIEQLVGQGGKDRFTGSPIVPRAMIDSYAADQFTPYTSTLSIKIGQIFEKAGIELSPARLDHAVSGFLGGLGRDLMLGGGWLFYGSSTGIADSDSDREDELSDMTLVGGLFQRGGQMARRSKSVDELYDLAEASVKLQKRLGDDEPPLAREKRLMLADAASAVSLLNVLATTHADKVDVRRELLAYRIEVAKKAIAEFESDNPNRSEISGIRNEMRDRLKQAKLANP